MHRHVLICGAVGAGKSTLISKILAETEKPLYGYCTKSRNKRADGGHEIYMFPAGKPEDAVKLAECGREGANANTEIFETLGVSLIERAENNGIIIMDEIGFMERDSEKFKAAVLKALDGDIPVLGAVKAGHNDCDFLNAVRGHRNADLFR